MRKIRNPAVRIQADKSVLVITVSHTAPATMVSRPPRDIKTPPMPPSIPPDAPRGSFLGGLLCQLCLSHQGPLGHAWLGTPGAPGHVCRGQPWSPRSPASRLPWGRSSRSIARSPPPLGAWLPRPGARPPLCPRPPVIPPSNGVQAPAPPRPTPAAPGARGPRPPRRPPPVAPLCAGGPGDRGGRPRPLHFFQECAAHAPPMGGLLCQQAAATFRACLMTLAQPTPFSPESATSF